MSEHLLSAIKSLKGRFAAEDYENAHPRSLLVSVENIHAAVLALRDEFEFNFLTDETAVDYWPEEEPRMHVVYQLYSYNHNVRVSLRVPLNGNALTLPTVTDIFPCANWHERELWDMFGIRCEGHPDLRRILMPYDWEGHPLRKDYPLGYEEPQFTFNYDDIQQRKHKAGYVEA